MNEMNAELEQNRFELVARLEERAKVELDLFLAKPSARLKFPTSERPKLSILIVTYNKAEYTYRCLKSILACCDVDYEVVLVDNNSTDQTRAMLAKCEQLNTVLNSQNVYYSEGNNIAARNARAPYILLLNNDTEITPGAMSALVERLDSDEKLGTVGAKIVWPDGRLQEAGSIIWSDGSCLGYGRGESALKPEYNYYRDVDYVSGTAIAFRRELFFQLGGIDRAFDPAYYEETDLCMKVISAGYRNGYEPRAEIYHYEFTSTGKERALSLMKLNHVKFFDRWKDVLGKAHLANVTENSILRARDKRGKRTLLIVDDQVPEKSMGQGFGRAEDMLLTLSDQFQITFFPMAGRTTEPKLLEKYQTLGIEVMEIQDSFEGFLRGRKNFYDVIMCSRPHNFDKALPSIREYSATSIRIYDAEALFYSRAFIKNKVIGSPSIPECEAMKLTELELLKAADHIIVVSEGERASVLKELPGLEGKIFVYGHALDAVPHEERFNQRRDLLFLGAFVADDTPNVDALKYFVENVFPQVAKAIDCNLIIAGKDPTPYVHSLASERIQVLGFVEDSDPLFRQSRIFIIPHRYAGGIPFKLSEAMSFGLPTVATELISKQFGLDKQTLGIGVSAESFANEVIAMYNDESLWNQRRESGLEFIRRTHSIKEMHDCLLELFNSFKRF